MTDHLYDIYINLQNFITNPEYRNYALLDAAFLEKEEFINKMQEDQYIMCNCTDKSGKKVVIILFKEDSIYMGSVYFKQLLGTFKKEENIELIIITNKKLKAYTNRISNGFPNIEIHTYLHKNFVIEIPKGPMCSKHSALSNEEVDQLINEGAFVHPLKLPAILITDPQIIWIGAKVGQIVKIESLSKLTGNSIYYRIVVPEYGRFGKLIYVEKEEVDIEEEEKKIFTRKMEEMEHEEKDEVYPLIGGEDYYTDSDYSSEDDDDSVEKKTSSTRKKISENDRNEDESEDEYDEEEEEDSEEEETNKND
jgi:DNA-directed RNA polymerase subunit H (RpoH/RPB5)